MIMAQQNEKGCIIMLDNLALVLIFKNVEISKFVPV